MNKDVLQAKKDSVKEISDGLKNSSTIVVVSYQGLTVAELTELRRKLAEKNAHMSERMVKDDVYTSIHIEAYDLECRETKLGNEEITRDVPNVSEDAKTYLDESGIIIPGAEVKEGDILVGKVTPKGQTEPTPEEKLLMAIFAEKTKDGKDSSLRVPHGDRPSRRSRRSGGYYGRSVHRRTGHPANDAGLPYRRYGGHRYHSRSSPCSGTRRVA